MKYTALIYIMSTRNGIYYDLSKSVYHFKTEELIFVFSSYLHYKKFVDRHQKHRHTTDNKLSQRYTFTIITDVLADLILYKQIESRGFLVLTKDGEEICKENLTLSLKLEKLKK